MAVSRAILTFERVKRARGNQANGVNSSEEFLGLENRWKKVDNKMGMRTTRRLDELFKFLLLSPEHRSIGRSIWERYPELLSAQKEAEALHAWKFLVEVLKRR
jgi:hypothetical protein